MPSGQDRERGVEQPRERTGDRVEVEMSPYDLTKARIVYRYRAGEARRAQ